MLADGTLQSTKDGGEKKGEWIMIRWGIAITEREKDLIGVISCHLYLLVAVLKYERKWLSQNWKLEWWKYFDRFGNKRYFWNKTAIYLIFQLIEQITNWRYSSVKHISETIFVDLLSDVSPVKPNVCGRHWRFETFTTDCVWWKNTGKENGMQLLSENSLKCLFCLILPYFIQTIRNLENVFLRME